MMKRRHFLHAAAALIALAADPALGAVRVPTLAQRVRAARQTAQAAAACVAIAPFYWEIGDKSGALASGSVGSAYTQASAMNIASASKLVWGAYMVERGITEGDVALLNFTSGYCNMQEQNFPNSATVDSVLTTGSNGQQSSDAVGKFAYNGGHMQEQAHLLGLGPLGNAALAREIQSRVGSLGFTFTQPVPSGGIRCTPAAYAAFLRAILRGSLRMRDFLGTHAVVTQGPGAISSPAPKAWHYSLGHWVEDDPTGDGAFSSAGAFGFYPWIDAGKAWYGVVARIGLPGSGEPSADAGARIRKAWLTGQVQA